MENKTIIKLLRNRTLVGQSEFTNYEKALTYAKYKVEEGFTCLILRLTNGKEWVKFYLTPSEVM